MKKRYLICVLLLTCGYIFADSGNDAATVLQEDLGAVGAGLGGAATALLGGDVTFLRYNPASLGGLKNGQLSTMYYDSVATGMNFGSFTYGQPVGFGTFALSVAYLNAGVMDLNYSNGNSVNVVSEQDLEGIFSFGTLFFNTLALGFNAKVLSSSIIGTQNATALAGDLGLIYKDFVFSNLNFGASYLNFGTGITYLNTNELLPTSTSLGLSYDFNIGSFKFQVSSDLLYMVNDQTTEVRTGLESSINNFALRLGIPINSSNDALATAGIGYKVSDYRFDYTATFGKSLGITHRIGIELDLNKITGDSNKPTPEVSK